MSELKTAMDIFKLLEKSNCRECNEATCLAFASAVHMGRKSLNDCPRLDREIVAQYEGSDNSVGSLIDQSAEETLQGLKQEIRLADFQEAAQRTGATVSNGRLTLRVCGKPFSVDTDGNLSADIHVHAWLAIPVLNYILRSAGKPVSGKWVPLRELNSGQDWYRLFGQRCENPLKKVADSYTDLFEDMIHLFDGRQVEKHYQSDISLVLYPLPLVPILFCYWKPEDGMESSMNLFFDETAEDNLDMASIYGLGTGLVTMLEKIALRHGV